MDYNRGQLKQEVKAAMKADGFRPVLATLLFVIIVGVGSSLLSFIINLVGTTASDVTTAYFQYVMTGADPDVAMEQLMNSLMRSPGMLAAIMGTSLILSLLTFMWSSLMSVGYKGYCLSMVRRENPPLERIFCAFPQTGWVLLTEILTGVFSFLWTLLFGVGAVVVSLIGALLMDLVPALGVLLIVAGYAAYIVGLVWVYLRYAMVDYLLLDGGLVGLDAIRQSKELMKGNKGRYLLLNLSFIGWYLVECAIMLVGMVIAVVIVAAAVGADFGGVMSGGMMAGMVSGVIGGLLVIGLAVLIVFVFNLWLKPYVVGASARFYDWLTGRQSDVLPGGSVTYTAADAKAQEPWDDGSWNNGEGNN